jgi:transcriptional regulator with XRE-family HTH domain
MSGKRLTLALTRSNLINSMASRSSRLIDAYVGRRARERRLELGLSCEVVAEMVSLPPEAVRDFEVGSLRLEPAKLADVAAALHIPVRYFYCETKQGESSQVVDVRRLQAFGPRLTPSTAQELQEIGGRQKRCLLWMIAEVHRFFYAFVVTEDGVGSGWLTADSLTKLRRYLPSGLVRSNIQPSETPGVIEIWMPAE